LLLPSAIFWLLGILALFLVWFGLVWFGLVWFGLVWFGLVMVGSVLRVLVCCCSGTLLLIDATEYRLIFPEVDDFK
jgi:hypothetical protein